MNALDLARGLVDVPDDEIRKLFASMTKDQARALLRNWKFWRRPDQCPPPGDWSTWVVMAGRGWGKSRVSSEQVLEWMVQNPGCRIALLGATAGDVIGTMLEGESGLLNIAPTWFPLKHIGSKCKVLGPNGSAAYTFSADAPDRLRGPQFHFAAVDELASFPEPYSESDDTAYRMLGFGLRLGQRPRCIITTTPKPTKTLFDLEKQPGVVITHGHSFDNVANLATPFIQQMKQLYGGTRLGAQELAGTLLRDTPGALYKVSMFIDCAVTQPPELERIVIAVDPALSANANNDSTGIIAIGRGRDGHAYVLENATIKGSPDKWARTVIKCFHKWKADLVVGEVNACGDLVESVIHSIDSSIPFKPVRAMRNKSKRAEVPAALVEQGKVHLVGDPNSDAWLPFLQQARKFTGINGRHDDAIDAFAWGVFELLVNETTFFLL